MYKDLRASGKFSYDVVNEMFDRHQGAWPEALKLEDSNFKYIQPYINDGENRLEMCLGFKKEQRKFWLYNRFKYMDSKYNAGDASADSVSMRSWYTPASGETTYGINITPYADIYATVLYGVAKSSVRANRNVASLVPCTLSHMEFTDTYIYSASQIKDFGDLSIFRPDAVEFSKAVNAQSLKFGDASSSYTNPNLKALTLGNNVKLKKLDIRNCINLGTGDQKTLPLDGCTNIEEVYADGTALRGITFANGGILKKLHLPATVQNLTLMNQKFISEFICPDYSNITTLRLEGNASTIDTEAIVRNVATGARVRLVGFTWEVADSTELLGLKAILDNYRGLDEQGGNMDTAQLSGTIHATSLTGEAIAEFNAKYPYVNITADSVESTRYFYNEDGSTLIGSVTCLNGVAQSAAPTQPEKSATAQYNYTKVGWNSSKNAETNNYDHSAVTMGDVSYYAAYSKSLRSYTVTWKNSDATTLKTDTVNYGVTPSYTGSTPVDPSGEGLEFKEWTPAIAPITGNITYTAIYDSGVEDVEISDSWDTIIANIDNGTYKTKYKVGNYKPLDLGTEGVINMQIVAMDADEASNGSGTVPLTFIGKELLKTLHNINPTATTAGGWAACGMRSYLSTAIEPLIPSAVANRIVVVNKTQSIATSSAPHAVQTTSDKLWIPSIREVFGDYNGNTSFEVASPTYVSVFKDKTARIKKIGTLNAPWWVRSAYYVSNFLFINSDGLPGADEAKDPGYVCLGFCLGTYIQVHKSSDTLEDVIAASNDGTYATKYKVGDIFDLDLGSEGNVMAQIAAFDAHDKADGTGKAHVSLVAVHGCVALHRMNDTETTEGGWEASSMRSYIGSTIKPLVPEAVRNALVPVTLTQDSYTSGSQVTQTTTDDLFILSMPELNPGGVYNALLGTNQTRKKSRVGSQTSIWWLRSASSSSNFHGVGDGILSNYRAQNRYAVVLGFCL